MVIEVIVEVVVFVVTLGVFLINIFQWMPVPTSVSSRTIHAICFLLGFPSIICQPYLMLSASHFLTMVNWSSDAEEGLFRSVTGIQLLAEIATDRVLQSGEVSYLVFGCPETTFELSASEYINYYEVVLNYLDNCQNVGCQLHHHIYCYWLNSRYLTLLFAK